MQYVWYAAYGSNILRERFACYLAGGRPAGGRRATPGARDPSPPTADRRIDLPHPLLFGGPSHTWQGGPAYLDTERPGHTTARVWRITREQFEDVIAQENGLPPGSVDLTDDVLERGGTVLDTGYGRVVPLPAIGAEPVLTFTFTRRPAPRAADPAYLALIRKGLSELGLAPDQMPSSILPETHADR